MMQFLLLTDNSVCYWLNWCKLDGINVQLLQCFGVIQCLGNSQGVGSGRTPMLSSSPAPSFVIPPSPAKEDTSLHK